MTQVALVGRDPIFLTVKKWCNGTVSGQVNGSRHKFTVGLKDVAHVVGKSCQVGLTRTGPGAVKLILWLADHGVAAGATYDAGWEWYQVVVSDDDLPLTRALLDGMVINPITGAVTPKPAPCLRRNWRARIFRALYH